MKLLQPIRRRRISGLLFPAIVLAFLTQLDARSEQEPAKRLEIWPPEKGTFTSDFAVSPDGRHLVFGAAVPGGPGMLWLRVLDAETVKPLPGTEHGGSPFWSPDSRQIGFIADAKLKTVAIAGGTPRVVCDAPTARGATWSQEGVILIAMNSRDGLYRVPVTGGTPTPATILDASKEHDSHRGPQFFPDGRRFFVGVRTPQRQFGGLHVGSLDSKEVNHLPGIPFRVAYASGYLLTMRQARIMAQPFDLSRLESTGDLVSITEPLEFSQQTGAPDFSASNDKVLAYRNRGPSPMTELVWFDRTGKRLEAVGQPAPYRGDIRLSPDGRRVAVGRVDVETGTTDIWVLDLATGAATRLTSNPANEGAPVWDPDGSRLVFTSTRDGMADLYQKAATGSGSETLLHKSGATKMPSDWSSDGRFVVYHTTNVQTAWDLWVYDFTSGKALPLVQTKIDEFLGTFSPDGRWVAYVTNPGGEGQIHVRGVSKDGPSRRVSEGPGALSQWRRDGKELFYVGRDSTLMAVSVQTSGSDVTFGRPQPLFKVRLPAMAAMENGYVPSPDGQRFLMNTAVDSGPKYPIVVLMNWRANLKGDTK